jgi:DNA invertase Pin-like site-specific DNA recombinase
MPEKPESNQGCKNQLLPIRKTVDFCMHFSHVVGWQWRAVMRKRAAIYVRVSTDKQTVENQVRELRQIAERRGWEVVEEYRDAGISGAEGRENRPGLDQMLKDASKRRFDVVMAWAIDRLGRSLIDLLSTIQTLEACGADLYLDQQSIDTTTPAGKLMFQVTGAFAEFERSMIRQRVNAGLKRAVEQGKQLGRPKIAEALEKRIRTQLRAGKGILKVAREFGVGTGTVQRIKDEMSGPFDAAAAA